MYEYKVFLPKSFTLILKKRKTGREKLKNVNHHLLITVKLSHIFPSLDMFLLQVTEVVRTVCMAPQNFSPRLKRNHTRSLAIPV